MKMLYMKNWPLSPMKPAQAATILMVCDAMENLP
jgi:hypothetical protein